MSRKNDKQRTTKFVYIAFGCVVALLVVAGLIGPSVVSEEGTGHEPVNAGMEERGTDSEKISVSQVCIEVESDIDVRKSAGSGVVYNVSEEGAWIATAAHVLEEASDNDEIVLSVDDSYFPCKQLVLIKEADLAFVYVANDDLSEEKGIVLEAVSTDKTSYDALAAGTMVTAKGYRSGENAEYMGELTESWIYVEDFEQYMMLAQCEVHQGMSGGGLYDGEGNFIGMVCGGNEEGELVAVPWHVMQARFEESAK